MYLEFIRVLQKVQISKWKSFNSYSFILRHFDSVVPVMWKMKCYHLDTFFLFTISINLCYLDLCSSEKNSSSNSKKVVKTWKTDFQNGFENWTVKKDSPWIIEKWDDVLVKHNHTHLRFHNGAKPFYCFFNLLLEVSHI